MWCLSVISCNLFQLIISPFLGPETSWMPSPWLSLKNYKIYPTCNLCNIFCKDTGMWTYCDLEFRLNNENLYFIFILCSVPFLSWLFNKTTGPNHWTNHWTNRQLWLPRRKREEGNGMRKENQPRVGDKIGFTLFSWQLSGQKTPQV